MEIIGTIDITDELLDVRATRVFADGGSSSVDNPVQAESLLQVFVNDILTMQLGCSASHLVELVVGRLFTEGIVKSAQEIDCLSICEQGMRADVYLKDREADLSRTASRIVPTCCTNNVTLNSFFEQDTTLAAVEPIEWNPAWIFRLAAEFAEDKTAHARTRGVHSAYLAMRDRTLVVREDIGRHNAFDKAVGWALVNDIDLTQCLVFTSGRIPTDMVTKAIRARIPVLASKAVATDKTVELARRYGLALICSATTDSFDLMNGQNE